MKWGSAKKTISSVEVDVKKRENLNQDTGLPDYCLHYG
jgi:hypothetical protein